METSAVTILLAEAPEPRSHCARTPRPSRAALGPRHEPGSGRRNCCRAHQGIGGTVRPVQGPIGSRPGTPDGEITSDIWGLPETERPVLVVLFVEEVAELFLVATKKGEEPRDEMVTHLIGLAQLGRAADIYLEVWGQRFGGELGKGATLLRFS